MNKQRTYLAIDLKSFYASVECADRGLDPLTTHLVVADESRTEKTICLAVTPALKSYGIGGRARLFEVNQRVRQINAGRQDKAPGGQFTGASVFENELKSDPSLRLDFIVAPPRMAHYMDVSARIYQIYNRFVAPEDIHVYSIDEVFMDVTDYLPALGIGAHALAMRIIHQVLKETGITATAGIGTNLYLAKVAMDIVAKHIPADRDGVRIAELDEMAYRRTLWNHRPLTDFWRIGPGYARKLEALGLYTMGDVARCSLGGKYSPYGEDKLYRLFGINAELLIDHAWGYESCTMAHIKAYVPEDHSLSSGQVLHCPYEAQKARLVVREMADNLALDLVGRHLVTDQVGLYVGYDRESLQDPARMAGYDGPIEADYYGRQVPKGAHGSIHLPCPASSATLITEAITALYDRIVNPYLLVRRMYVSANHVCREEDVVAPAAEQMDLFTDYAALQEQRARRSVVLARENRRQRAVLAIKQKYGKNAILRGMNLEDGATARDRNAQIGGHKA